MKRRMDEGTLMLKRNSASPILLYRKTIPLVASVQSEIAVEFSDYRTNQKCYFLPLWSKK